MKKPEWILESNLETAYFGFDQADLIDHLSGIAGDKVYIYSGRIDSEVWTGVVKH